jgi:prepilin-type processing-associated H-X9-DG protein
MLTRHISRTAFTMVEMLVDVAIMALIAMALIPAIRTALDQGDSARCQAHLKHLHQACLNYLAEEKSFPRAGSFETDYIDNGKKYFRQYKGWVTWVRNDGKDLNPWAEDNTESHADEYIHTGWRGAQAGQAIRQGTLFKYTGENLSTYMCPALARRQRGVARDGYRGYALNYFLGARRKRYSDLTFNDLRSKNGSNMGLFVEIDEPNPKISKAKGEAGDSTSTLNPIADDSAWDWDLEHFGAWHRKSGKMHGHVVFVDGHVESVAQGDGVAEESEKIGDGTR